MDFTKHELISCERCSKQIECKSNSFLKCQCSQIQLNLNEVQYVSEFYEGCLCVNCLMDLQKEHQSFLKS